MFCSQLLIFHSRDTRPKVKALMEKSVSIDGKNFQN